MSTRTLFLLPSAGLSTSPTSTGASWGLPSTTSGKKEVLIAPPNLLPVQPSAKPADVCGKCQLYSIHLVIAPFGCASNGWLAYH